MDVNKVAVAVKELFQLEIDWLKSLPIDDKNKLFPDYVDLDRDHPINHICVTGEIALVILGIKPCCAVNHGYHTDYGKMLYEQVVKPWYNKHFDDEGGCNFVCELTKPGTAYYTGTLFDGGPGKRVDWGNSMLFWNISHPESDLVADVFTRTTRPTSNEEFRICFGIPAKDSGGRRNTCTRIEYQFQNPTDIYQIEDVCCSPCLEFISRDVDAAAVGAHFKKCREALGSIGYSIALDIHGQDKDSAAWDGISSQPWSSDAIATSWLAASGGDITRFMHMIKDDTLWVRCGMGKVNSIIGKVIQLSTNHMK